MDSVMAMLDSEDEENNDDPSDDDLSDASDGSSSGFSQTKKKNAGKKKAKGKPNPEGNTPKPEKVNDKPVKETADKLLCEKGLVAPMGIA